MMCYNLLFHDGKIFVHSVPSRVTISLILLQSSRISQTPATKAPNPLNLAYHFMFNNDRRIPLSYKMPVYKCFALKESSLNVVVPKNILVNPNVTQY